MKKTILVADDYKNEREKVRGLLEPTYNVILAADGRVAVETFGKIKIHGAILDYQMMPEWHPCLQGRSHKDFYGDAVARGFRQAGFTGPIVIRSSMADCLVENVHGLDVLLHLKNDDDQKILDYLDTKFNQE